MNWFYNLSDIGPTHEAMVQYLYEMHSWSISPFVCFPFFWSFSLELHVALSNFLHVVSLSCSFKSDKA